MNFDFGANDQVGICIGERGYDGARGQEWYGGYVYGTEVTKEWGDGKEKG